MKNKNGIPKVLLLDIEISPMISYTWGLFHQNIALNQLKKDWHIIAWSAKWLDDPVNKIMYADQRYAKDIEDDKDILKKLWELMDEADVIVGQNSNSFDIKKIFARFLFHGMKPPSPFRKVDTLQIAKKVFGFTSNKLEYMSKSFNKQFKKLDHKNFPGFELWKECLAGNPMAWKEMEKYNKFDVLSLEELYKKLIPWDNSIDFSTYTDSVGHLCSCGSEKFQKRGFAWSGTGKFQRYVCSKCGAWSTGKENLLSKDKKKSLRAKAK